MRQIWLRIFIYTVGLLVLLQLGAFALHRYVMDGDELRRYMYENIRSLASALEGESSAGVKTAAALFGHRGGRLWVVTTERDGQEVVLAGNKDFNRAQLDNTPDSQYRREDELEIWSMNDERRRFVAAVPLRLSDGEATLYVSYGQPPRGPRLWDVFMQGVIGFSLVGCILAFWLARRVSRPLRRLRGEVLEIAAGSMDKRVQPKGPDEVRDVALAVNHMADSLSKYIRNMRELVANISHELRSPLARMQVSLALLEEKLGGADEKTKAQLRLLDEEMNHMNKLIGDTLLSSKLDLHGAPPLTSLVAFSGLVGEMLRRHRPLMEKRGLAIEADIQENIQLPGDETLLCNLVSNYLDNAAKYTSADGTVRVRLFTEGGRAVFEVENTHGPIDPEVLEQVFEPFYRGGIATGGGVGLGLSLVRQIAALHQGEVSAANTPGGVIFRAFLPLERMK